MRVDLYTVCWNESDVLGFFFRHYDSWVDRYFVYDNGSTDGSLERLAQHPKVHVRQFERTHPESFVLSHQAFHNEVWKASRGQADWVVLTAIDEHLHVPGTSMREYLARCERHGVTLAPALGYQMLCDARPAPDEWLCQTRTWGAPYAMMNKLSVFKPDAMAETGFSIGRHGAEPCGEIRPPSRDEVMLLHYKYLGFEETFRRHQELNTGLGDVDRSNGWGVQYRWSRERLRQEWANFQARAVDVGRADFRPWQTFEGPRWWRAADISTRQGAEGRAGLDIAARDEEILRLQQLLHEQTRWNQQLRSQVIERDAEILRLQHSLDEQARWNVALRRELDAGAADASPA